MESISLGWNCYPASKGVELGIRKTKATGYNTCPFDECVTNYDGIIKCFEDDFKDFCNSQYLEIIKSPISTGGIKEGENLLYNNKYRFIFNHESPGHADLYISQKWEGGINHYLDDDYKLFKKRYENRINNFRNYLNSGCEIVFLIARYSNDVSKLVKIISEKYPNLKCKILLLEPNVDKEVLKQHYFVMKLSDDEIENELRSS